MPQIYIFYISENQKLYKFDTEDEAISFVSTFINGKREGETIECIHRVTVPDGKISELDVVLENYKLKFVEKQ